MRDAVSEIKNRLSIVDVVSPYVELIPAGKNLKGRSPFTNERTPSFYVSPERGMFYCFSSNQGGDIFTFIEKIEGIDFKGALKTLADRAGVELVPERPEAKTERDALYAVLDAARAQYVRYLADEPKAREYLAHRGVRTETIERWSIGYAPGPPTAGWRTISEALQKDGHQLAMIQKAGLVKGGDAGKAPYDVFRDRIMFPLFDASGRVVAFSGRLLTPGSEAPKYVNSPETDLYKKSELLFGYDRARDGIRKLGFSMIVEGQFDVVMCHQAGYTNTVAVSGTALTTQHVDLLQRLSQKVVLALDSDRAGIAALKKAAHVMLTRGMDVKVATLPTGADPADSIQADVAMFKRSVGEAVHVIEFLLAYLRREYTDTRAYTLQVREGVLPYLLVLPSALEREYFVGIVADALGSSKEAVRIELERLERTKSTAERVVSHDITPSTSPEIPAADRIAELTAFLCVAVTLVPDTKVQSIVTFLNQHLPESLVVLSERMSLEQKSVLLFTIEASFATQSERAVLETIAERARELVERVYSERIREEREILMVAEAEHDEVRRDAVLATIHTLQRAKVAAVLTL
jgi:DNA primase